MRIDPAAVARLILAGQAPPPEWLPHIVELRLERSYITDLRPLAGLTALRRLMLTRSRISDIAPLAALTRLQRLHLSFTAVSDVASLAAMTELEACFLTGSLVNECEPYVRFLRPDGGFVLWLQCLDGVDSAHVAQLAAEVAGHKRDPYTLVEEIAAKGNT